MAIVSVIIPAYNQGHYLREAIQSVLNQTYHDFDILVVDDGSTDNTSEIAHTFDDPRISYLYQDNRGLSGARNTGIRYSSGKYLTFLDSDDLFLPDKLNLLTDELENHPEIGFVAGQAIPIDESGHRTGRIFDTALPENPVKLLLGNPLHVGSVMLKRSWQEQVGFFDENLRSYEDWDMWLRLGLAGCKMGWVAQPVSLYRFHSHQMTRIGSQMTQASFIVLDKLFDKDNLPSKWLALHDQAYSNAHLRAAAQAYKADKFVEAKEHLTCAVELNPQLIAGMGESLVDRFIGWTELPKVNSPLDFLESIYDNLPENLETIRRRRREVLGYIALNQAIDAYSQGDKQGARKSTLIACRYRPRYLLKKRVISMLINTW